MDSVSPATNPRILVTGGAGFLGRYVVAELARRGYARVDVVRRAEFDLVTEAGVQGALQRYTPNIVVHLAAIVGGIGANAAHPGDFFYKNLMMGALLMEHSRLYGVDKFVAIGTVCAYPKLAPVPFREEDLWSGYPEETNAPYGLAKKMLLVQSQAYRAQFSFNSIFLLPVNLYGPHDNFDPESSHVIPAMIKKFFDAETAGAAEVVLWGDGSPTREFLYVADAARGIVDAMERYSDEGPVNLGSAFEISIRDLAVKIAAEVGYSGRIVWDTSKPNGQPRRKLDVSKAAELFGFNATTTFDQGLSELVEWYRTQRRSQEQPEKRLAEQRLL